MQESLEDDPPDMGEIDLENPLTWNDGFEEWEGEEYEPICTETFPSATQMEDMEHSPKRPRIDGSPFIHDVHPLAGNVYGHTPTFQEQWAAELTRPNMIPTNDFAPFTSSLDWKTAKWLMEDSSSKSASDRLLQIDGVW